MRTFHLTTPHMVGADVKHLQVLLTRNKCYSEPVDGEYGPLTAQAVYRAKYWLGATKPDHVAGPLLVAYLSGKKPTALMRLRTRSRLKAKAKQVKTGTIGQKALRAAIKDLGIKENPAGSNRSLISLWFGIIGAWCAMSVSRWNIFAGSKSFSRGIGYRYAYVPYMVADARAGRNNLTITHNPVPGDIVAYDWPGESPGIADHTGLFEKWLDRTAGTFSAIEGNTAIGNDSNGGEVMRRERNVSLVQCFIHVGK